MHIVLLLMVEVNLPRGRCRAARPAELQAEVSHCQPAQPAFLASDSLAASAGRPGRPSRKAKSRIVSRHSRRFWRQPSSRPLPGGQAGRAARRSLALSAGTAGVFGVGLPRGRCRAARPAELQAEVSHCQPAQPAFLASTWAWTFIGRPKRLMNPALSAWL